MRDHGTLDEFSVYRDGKLQFTRKSATGSRWVYNPFTFNGARIMFPVELAHINRGVATTGYREVSAMYVDFTWARVILSDRPVYNPGTRHHREIQIPLQWSNNQIVAEFNPGSFANGQTAYVYVIDSLGTVSAGHPITISGTQASAPGAPSNLRLLP
jgi:hypothetical protein